MAKPRSNGARQLSGQAKDLARLRMTDEEAREATEMLEMSQGLRCEGCGKRIKRGFHFTSIAVKEEAPALRLAACSREECSYATACRTGATYVEQKEFVWLDEAGEDAEPALSIVRRNERLEQRQAAASEAESRAEQSAPDA